MGNFIFKQVKAHLFAQKSNRSKNFYLLFAHSWIAILETIEHK